MKKMVFLYGYRKKDVEDNFPKVGFVRKLYLCEMTADWRDEYDYILAYQIPVSSRDMDVYNLDPIMQKEIEVMDAWC